MSFRILAFCAIEISRDNNSFFRIPGNKSSVLSRYSCMWRTPLSILSRNPSSMISREEFSLRTKSSLFVDDKKSRSNGFRK